MKHAERDDQKDLFELSPASEKSPSESIRSFFRLKSNPFYSVSLEHILVALIVLLILFVLVFMMGVLKGRSTWHVAPVAAGTLAAQPTALHAAGYETPAAPAAAPISSRPVSNIVPANAPAAPVANTAKKPYTIQLVTYRAVDRAAKEVTDLKARGFEARSIRRTGYFEVCVGRYADRKEAQKDLKILGARYKGCYLRKV